MNYNFDAMDKDELVEFFMRHRDGSGWPELHAGAPVEVTWQQCKQISEKLAEYALQKSAAMRYRESGKIDCSLVHEMKCDQIYNELPEWVRW